MCTADSAQTGIPLSRWSESMPRCENSRCQQQSRMRRPKAQRNTGIAIPRKFFEIVGCITTVMTVLAATTRHSCLGFLATQPKSCCGTLPSLNFPPLPTLLPNRRHLPVPPSTTRDDRCPVQHGTVRPNLSLQQLATTAQTWRVLRLLPSSNTCTIWSLPWLLGCPRSSIPVGIVKRVFSPAASAEEPRLRTD